ncbi:MAG: UDP-glucose 4-epimerase GalE [Chitinophagales bacterium]
MKILVTGGCGYIGSHTIVDLVEHGFEVLSIDDNSRSMGKVMRGVAKILGKKIKNYTINLTDKNALQAFFKMHNDIVGIIHFAAFKSVPESVAHPLRYYDNNLNSLINLLACVEEHQIPHFIFSSSCSVYGNVTQLPVMEDNPLARAESPYANTKQMGEDIIQHFAKINQSNYILLRYFNPVGAHPSIIIGEIQEKPQNLVPVITQTAIGKRESMMVFGKDYDTKDGSCVRDYIHVMDIANAHTKALQYLLAENNSSNCEVFNLGTGEGVTVLEAIEAFEKVSGQSLNYTLGERRPGDVIAVYANNDKAKTQLGWLPQSDIEDMMHTAWEWEKALANGIDWLEN